MVDNLLGAGDEEPSGCSSPTQGGGMFFRLAMAIPPPPEAGYGYERERARLAYLLLGCFLGRSGRFVRESVSRKSRYCWKRKTRNQRLT